MPGYNSNTQVYYCKQSVSPGPSHRIAPSPTISINPEIYYANDNVVGYTYTVTLNGYANALRKEVDSGSVLTGADETIQHMGDIRDILNFNGGNLYIKQGNNNIIVAKGATIKNLTFNNSDNRWVNYSPFTAELEFNEIDFIGCSNNPTIACNSSIFHTPNQSSNNILSDKLINIQQYKIKTFSDKWSFTIDNEVYQNNTFRVSYTLSATGKNYYVNDTLIPAWQQAKFFCQDRLYKQVKGLLDGILNINSSNKDGCVEPAKTTSTLHDIISGEGALSGSNFEIYNETVSCDTSESDGTFSVTYNSIIKSRDTNISNSENAAIHTHSRTESVSDGDKYTVSITVNGTVQGLIPGSFIHHNIMYELPANGKFITLIGGDNFTKYTNALDYYYAKIGTSSDLKPDTKDATNVTHAALATRISSGYPKPASFSLDHSYHEGTITYSASYDTDNARNQDENTSNGGITSISVVHNDPVDIIQEFIIPGRAKGPIIQKLNMKTPKTMSININGTAKENKQCITNLSSVNICNSLPITNIEGLEALTDPGDGWIKTKEDYNSNPIDGSFSISLEYTATG